MSDETIPKKEPKYIRGKYTPASGKAVNKYQSENYFTLRFKKRDKERMQQAADKVGMSLNAFVNDAVARRVSELLDVPEEQE